MEKYLTVKETAEQLGVHWQSVLTYIRQGDLKAIKIGRGYRITDQAVANLIQKRTTKPKDVA